MKTRAKNPGGPKSKAANASHDTSSQSSLPATKTLAPAISNPPHLFILPKDLSSAARILTLPNPATSTPNRYLLDPEKRRCYEFTRVAAPKKACRSWLLGPSRSTRGEDGVERNRDEKEKEGFVMEKADLMVATPVDPLFLVLPALAQDIAEEGGKGGRQMYLSPSDFLERLGERSIHFKAMNEGREWAGNLESMFEARMRVVCDIMEVGDDERLYRLSLAKLLEVLYGKAEKIISQSLFPASMEEQLVKQTLALPVLNVRREESGVSIAEEDQADGGAETDTASSSAATSQQDSQASTTTTTSTSTAATSVASEGPSSQEAKDGKEQAQIAHLLRLRTTFNYMLKSYIPASLQSSLHKLLSASNSKSHAIDFHPLDTHLARLDTLKKEAQTLRSLSDNISRKRSAADEDDAEALERADAKKRKKEEEEARKKNVSRGVKALEKVDRSGMKSLTSFFGKKAVAGAGGGNKG